MTCLSSLLSPDAQRWLRDATVIGNLSPEQQRYLVDGVARLVNRDLDLIGWAGRHLRHRLATFAPTPDDPFAGLSPFHIETALRLDELSSGLRGQFDCDLAPRGFAKSTWRTVIYPLREALENREPYILICSDTHATVKRLFENLRDELEGNKSLLAAYPHAAGRGPVWNQDEIRLRNGVIIEAVSTGEAIRGALRKTRPTLIIFDDLQNDDHLTSAALREQAMRWFERTLLPLGQPDTNFVGSGTAGHRDWIVTQLANRPGWRSRTYRALIDAPVNQDLWDDWLNILQDYSRGDSDERARLAREFFDQRRDAMTEGAVVLWPERFPLYDLMLRLANGGAAAFASEFQNNPTNPDASEWPEEYFDAKARPEFWFDDWSQVEGVQVKTLALDPSKGTRSKQGDYAAYVLFARDHKGVEYVEADLFRGSTDATVEAICRRGVRHVREFCPEAFGFEAIAFQQLFGHRIQQALAASNLEVRLVEMTDSTPKDVRIRRLTTPLAQRRIRFRRTPGTRLLIEQLRDWPQVSHDDGPDALEQARRLAIQVVEGRRAGAKPIQFRV